ncbi:MAG TPA: AarF/ABC1/UbiB kinase family protein [Candidatus Nanopelagicales bacterium]|nr:AarF/ABC1/UbiB kinase family protein [Candidatus Nanopelagicales bacterium]
MDNLPRRALTRGAKLASLPLGYAGRTAIGVGRRVGGAPAEAVTAEIAARTAAQVFEVLGELKGGAMKFGQAMSIFEAAMPEELIGPYRATLTKLQDAAPALPAATVHTVLSDALGPDWRERFDSFDDVPAAAASIGQVHRAVWADGREVAVKIQYPGAAKALLGDLNQISRMARMITSILPGIDVKPLLAELKERTKEELDYLLESGYQRDFAVGYEGDEQFVVPHVLAAAPMVLVSEWLEGYSLARVVAEGTPAERDKYGTAYLRFLLSGPTRVGLLHADPHPGNYRILADGRLGVVDFGAVARVPGGFSPTIGRLLTIAMRRDAESVLEGLREEGFVRPGVDIDAALLLDYLAPFAAPAEHEQFTFSRDWMREQFGRVNDIRRPDFTLGMKMTLPPQYLLIHRVWIGAIAVLSQLNATVPIRAELQRWVPGFEPE